MDWKKIGNIVGGAAPWLGSLLGGKVGESAGNLVASVLGCKPEPKAIEEAIAADPNALLKLKQAEMDHKVTLEKLAFQEKQLDAELDIEHRRIDTEDIQSARQRDIKLKSTGYRNTRADIMILVAFISFVLICWMINTNIGIRPEVLAIFNMAVGALLKMIGDAFQFEFGSSRGSKEKDPK